jgi:hypothetical protein
MPTELKLSANQKKKLLEVARKAIEHYIGNKKKIVIPNLDKDLDIKRAAFVTIKKAGKLRGCVGQLAPGGPLIECVRDMAIHAAFGDKRFSPVTIDEIPDIKIEISVLTPLQRCKDASDFDLGEDGIFVRGYAKSGTFLPKVAKENNMTREAFLRRLCQDKAGLKPDAYNDPNVTLYKFKALPFSEEQFEK